MTPTPGLDGAIKDLGDAIKDVEAAVKPGQSVVQRVMAFSNMIGDAMVEIPLIPGIKAEIAALQPDDFGRLAGELVSALGLSSAHAIAIVNALLKFIGDGAISDTIGLIHAIANKPA